MRDLAIGIDLGTSTSEIAIFQKQEPIAIPDPLTKTPIVPSWLAINQRQEMLVGEEAASFLDKPGCGAREIKRLMGSGQTITLGEKSYRPEELSALLLRRLRQNAEIYTGQEITEIVLSVPANFPDAARQATLTAGQLAGLKILHLINEPTAAALAFGIKHIEKEEQIVVFDFGGGTLDVTTLEMMEGILDVRSSFGDPQLGGKDIDAALSQLVLERFQQQFPHAEISPRSLLMLKSQVERTKCALSTQRDAHLHMPMFALHKGETIDLDIHLSRQDFNQAIAPLLDRARQCITNALRIGKITAQSVDRVLLVGGTTYIPAIQELVAHIFGKEPRADVHPDLAVTLGAATKAAMLTGLIDDQKGLILTDVAPYGLGIDVVSFFGHRPDLRYEPLILPNQTIPVSVKRSYSLLHDEQKAVEIKLFQDHTGESREIDDVLFTGIAGSIEDIPPAEDGVPHPIQIEFSYDINGLAKLTATIPTLNRSVTIQHQPSPERMAPDAQALALQRLDEIWQNTSKARRYKSLLRRSEETLRSLSDDHPLHHAVLDLKKALKADQDDLIEQAAEVLSDLLLQDDDE